MRISKYITFLFIAAASGWLVSGRICPYGTACNCSNYSVVCSNLQEMPALLTGDNIIAVTSLTFTGGNITNIPSNSLPPGLTSIAFNDLSLINISNDAFFNSADTLRDISFIRTNLTEMPQALLRLKNLTSLSITEVDFNKWDENILAHLSGSLLVLSLEKLTLTSWPAGISLLKSLNVIEITNNPITSVPDDAFHLMGNTLDQIYLDENSLTSIPYTANLFKLRVLFLAFNRISTISSNKLSPSIEILDLSYNKIKEITDTSFPENFLVDNLELDNNPISKITDLALKNLKQVTKVSMFHSNLAEFPLAVTSLKTLKRFYMISTTKTKCPCPPKQEVVQWYESYNGNLELNVECEHFVGYDVYLSGGLCSNTTTAAVTTTTAATTLSTTDDNSGVPTTSHKHCGYLCLILTWAISLLLLQPSY